MISKDTFFASAARSESSQLLSQVDTVNSDPIINALLLTSTGVLTILNENRQIVALNKAFLEQLGIADPEKALGLRLGESLHCKYAFDEPNGCGTTRLCSSCGAAIAIVSAVDDNATCERICAISTDKDGTANDICLLVKAQPFMANQKRWILVFAQDISRQEYWNNMESVFFHDILNTLNGLKLCSDLVFEELPTNELTYQLKTIADTARKEVLLQATLARFKDQRTDGIADIAPTSLNTIKNQVFTTIMNGSLIKNKTLVEEGHTEDLALSTDALLATKVLLNMLLNALEATEAGGVVKFRTILEESQVRWQVWNRSSIPEEIQPRIFQKYFSTKPARGHGMGTYSMRFFGEECLGGTVGFTSSAEEGTTFTFSLPRGARG